MLAQIFTLAFLSIGLSFSAWGAARAIFIPVPPEQALLVVQTVNMDTGAMDNDPHVLYDLLNVPENTLPSGDKGKILETADKSVLLTCIERPSGNRQCQFHVKDSAFSKIDKSTKRLGYYREDGEAQKWWDQVKPTEQGKLLFVTSDGKLQFYVTPKTLEINYED
ncbi:MAG: hypothetical protein H6624_17095 [Bdellovibrionaceae bacterium]|nr:hypothetical protein [Bdellovibrionales bacterium]MCB9086064.1 hypothetical protein [Pseudobdellovibrionaceae bacterium]